MANMQRSPQSEHVVVLTNSATAENRDHVLQCGAHAVFDKTTEINDFFAYCNQLEVA